MSNPIEKPTKPLDDDCCGGGACAPCVWDHFYEQLSIYRKQQRALEAEAKEAEQQEQKQGQKPLVRFLEVPTKSLPLDKQ